MAFLLSHRKEKSPLTHGLNYRSACDINHYTGQAHKMLAETAFTSKVTKNLIMTNTQNLEHFDLIAATLWWAATDNKTRNLS